MNKNILAVIVSIAVLCFCLACTPSSSGSKTGDTTTANTSATPPGIPKKTTTPAATTAPAVSGLPVINNFTATPALISPGDLSNLQWEVSNATAVSISPTIGGVGPIGTQMVQPATSTEYKITASNDKGAVSAVATVMIEKPYSFLAPVFLSLKIEPRVVSENNTCQIYWDIHAADSVALYYETADSKDKTVIAGRLTPTGKMIVKPTYTLTSTQQTNFDKTAITVANMVYTIEAVNRAGTTTASVDVNVLRSAIIPIPGRDIPIVYDNVTVLAATVLPIIGYFSAEPINVIQGNTTTLTWEVTQATKVLLNGVQVPLAGSQVVSPGGATTYILSASNEYWTSTRTVTIGVLSYNKDWFKPVEQ